MPPRVRGLYAVVAVMSLGAGLAAATAPAGAAAPAWSANHRLGIVLGPRYPTDPQVAVNASGAVAAAWLQQQTAHRPRGIYVELKSANGGWGGAHALARGYGDHVSVGIDAAGRVLAVWSLSGSRTGHWSRYLPGHGWTAARSIDVGTSPVSVAPSGFAVLGYAQVTQPDHPLTSPTLAYVRRMSPAGRWGRAIRVSAAHPPNPTHGSKQNLGAEDVRATTDDSGAVVAVWFWGRHHNQVGTAGNVQTGGTDAHGHVVAVRNTTADDRPGPLSTSPGGTVAFREENGNLISTRLGGVWRSHALPTADWRGIDPIAVAAGDDGVTVWWADLTDDAHTAWSTTLYTVSERPDGTWTEPAVLFSGPGLLEGLVGARSGDRTELAWSLRDRSGRSGVHLVSTTPGGATTALVPGPCLPASLAASGVHAVLGADYRPITSSGAHPMIVRTK